MTGEKRTGEPIEIARIEFGSKEKAHAVSDYPGSRSQNKVELEHFDKGGTSISEILNRKS